MNYPIGSFLLYWMLATTCPVRFLLGYATKQVFLLCFWEIIILKIKFHVENLIFFLDLSHNFLSGYLPLWSSNSIHHLHLEDNNFSGSIPNEFFNISELLLTLDVSDNRLSGSIPSAIANAASSLRILSLRGNCLSGTFPTQLCQLTQISKMDLSRNFFSGTIPRCFQYLVTAFTPFDLAFSTQTGGNDNGQSEEYGEQDEVNIVTKYRNSSYTGNILNYMLGLDLSVGNLTKIPTCEKQNK